MSKEMSIESLYANGMGIELPISNVKDSSQTQESYDCSSIIDNTNITNSLEYLEYHSLIEKNNTKDMIKLNKKLNDHYGKYNKSLESYLINNANTSKENYNNYINTNKELYNELIMSRGTEGLFTVGIITNLLSRFLNKKLDPENQMKKMLENNPNLSKIITDYNTELKSFSDKLAGISKISTDIDKKIEDKFKLDNQHDVEFSIRDGHRLNDDYRKRKILKDSNNIIKSIIKNDFFNGKTSNFKELILPKYAHLYFTFKHGDEDDLNKTVKIMNQVINFINSEILSKYGLIVKYNSVDKNVKYLKDGFSILHMDIHYKFKKDYSVIRNIIEKEIKK